MRSPHALPLTARIAHLPRLAVRHTLRQVKHARKRALRGVKLARWAIGRLKDAEKSLYFRLRDSDRGRALLSAADLTRASSDVRTRRHTAAPYIARLRSVVIDPDKGYGLVSVSDAADFARTLASCRRLFEAKQREVEARLAGFDSWTPERQEKYRSQKQSFLRYLLDDEDLRQHPELVEFALDDRMLGAATQYLGMVPYFSRLDLMYSLPRGNEEKIASQLFHLDHEGLTQVKFFLHLFDVGDAEGPFTFIPADESARIIRDIRVLRRERGLGRDVESRRYLDEEVAAVGGHASIVIVKGPTGMGAAVDTSRCLHLGSRVSPGTFRLCLYLQYCTTREVTNVFDVERFSHDPVRYLAVKHSREPGRARATDYAHRMTAG
jgi:hypothetical protein